MYKAYRFYIGSGYIEIQANSEQEARDKHGNHLITMHDKKDTFVCFSLNGAHNVEVIEENRI